MIVPRYQTEIPDTGKLPNLFCLIIFHISFRIPFTTMPKHKSAETIDSSDSSSDSGPDPEPAPKKSKKEKKEKKKTQEDDGEKEHMYALSRQRFCNVREFRGKVLIDIREYYEADGEMKPGKKGISLTVEQWRKLESKVDEINESIQALT